MSKLEKIPIAKQLAESSVANIVTIPEVAERFQSIYKTMNGVSAELAKVRYETEKFHFQKMLQDKPELQKCSKLSLYGVFLDAAVAGLSFDPQMKHLYVVGFNTKVKVAGQPDRWESRATMMISGPGELVIRMKQGQIKYADNPVLVYEGDKFTHGTKRGTVYLDHEAKFPRDKDAQIIAGYIRLERNDGTVDYKVMSDQEVQNLRAFSKDPESLAWTKGYSGMFQTKLIKHAFKGYPKLKIGQFSGLLTEKEEVEEVPMRMIDYGLDGEHDEPQTPAPEKSPKKDPPKNWPPVKEAKTANIPEAPAPDEDNWDESDSDADDSVQMDDDDF